LDSQLANNQNPEQKPKVSKLPLPVSDSPLVIDLPDGQKIVIGKMTQGSVIEVATWRGVGRPDSRTSRLMLGVGNGNVEEDPEEKSLTPQGPQKAKKPQDWRIVLYYFAQVITFIQNLPWKKVADQLKALVKRSPKKIKAPIEKSETTSSPEIPAVSTEKKATSPSSAIEDDIEAWLNKISEKAANKSVASVPTTEKTAKKASPSKKVVKKTAKPKAKRK
jgi:hypothetical protein